MVILNQLLCSENSRVQRTTWKLQQNPINWHLDGVLSFEAGLYFPRRPKCLDKSHKLALSRAIFGMYLLCIITVFTHPRAMINLLHHHFFFL